MIGLEVLQGNEDAMARAREIISNHNRLIAMQRSARKMGKNEAAREIISNHNRLIAMATGVVHPDMVLTEVPIIDPITKKNIGTAYAKTVNGVFHIERAFLNRDGVEMLGINMRLISFEPGRFPEETPGAYVEAQTQSQLQAEFDAADRPENMENYL